MGGTSSKNKVKSIQESVNRIASSSVSKCTTTVGMNQDSWQNSSGINIGSSQTIVQNTTVTSSCLNDTTRTTKLATDIANQIAQAASADSVGGVGALNTTSATTDTAMAMKVKNALTTQSISTNFQQIMMEQRSRQNQSGINIFSSQKAIQGTEVYAKAVNKSLEDAGIYADLEAKIDQQASATTSNPLDVFFAWIPWIIVGMVAISLGVIYLFYARPELAQQLIFAFTAAKPQVGTTAKPGLTTPGKSPKVAPVSGPSQMAPVPSVRPTAPPAPIRR